MVILKSKTISELQENFSTVYPGLKIEFYNITHEKHEGNSGNSLSPELLLKEVYPDMKEGTVSLKKDLSVEAFESYMQEQFSISVQVFRRSDDLWLQTINTDSWSLEVQNRKGLKSTLK